MSLLLELGETSVDGFINPGHVSTIIGTEGYRSLDERFHVPQVIAGFEPIDVLYAIAMIIRQVNKGRGEIENAYKRAVKKEGNTRAKAMMAKVFEPTDAPWRGIGMIPSSGLRIRKEYSAWDASERFGLEAEAIYEMPSGCRCGEVLRAVIYPWDCPLFNTACRPDSPLGPCMVSHEGSCFISAKYGVESP
jgi:hydrogenase expression/formation protein HypD